MPPPVSTQYPVRDDEAVSVRVTIGEGQAGGSAVFLGRDLIGSGHEVNVRVGQGVDLRGQTLVISSTVVDVRPETNRVSTLTELFGGIPTPQPIGQADVVGNGGAADFLTIVQFV